jgi:hypothetical protein
MHIAVLIRPAPPTDHPMPHDHPSCRAICLVRHRRPASSPTVPMVTTMIGAPAGAFADVLEGRELVVDVLAASFPHVDQIAIPSNPSVEMGDAPMSELLGLLDAMHWRGFKRDVRIFGVEVEEMPIDPMALNGCARNNLERLRYEGGVANGVKLGFEGGHPWVRIIEEGAGGSRAVLWTTAPAWPEGAMQDPLADEVVFWLLVSPDPPTGGAPGGRAGMHINASARPDGEGGWLLATL